MVWIVLRQVFCSGGMKGFWGGHQALVWQKQIPRWNLFHWKDLLRTNPLRGLQILMEICIEISIIKNEQDITLQKPTLYNSYLTAGMDCGQLCNFLPDRVTLPLVFPEQVAGPP